MYRQLMKVSKGFRLVYVGILLIIMGMIGGLLGMCIAGGVAGAGAAGGGAGLAVVVAGGMMLCMLIGGIMGLVGRFLCLAVPEEAGPAKPLIIMSVIFELTGLALTFFINAGVVVGRRLAGNAGLELQLAGMICSLTSAVLFLLFTRAAARFVRRSDLADAAMLVLGLWVGTIVCYGIIAARSSLSSRTSRSESPAHVPAHQPSSHPVRVSRPCWPRTFAPRGPRALGA
jgi:hypothetical protein